MIKTSLSKSFPKSNYKYKYKYNYKKLLTTIVLILTTLNFTACSPDALKFLTEDSYKIYPKITINTTQNRNNNKVGLPIAVFHGIND